jgi:hypothetical protein
MFPESFHFFSERGSLFYPEDRSIMFLRNFCKKSTRLHGVISSIIHLEVRRLSSTLKTEASCSSGNFGKHIPVYTASCLPSFLLKLAYYLLP